jgi:GDPmannose 4,6-dehydratase
MPRALITGIAGQDGSYLAELLLAKGYEVHGTLRRQSSIAGTWRIDQLLDQLQLHHSDVTDGSASMRLLAEVQPDEIYHLAAQSHVGVSFETPDYTANVDAIGTLRLLEAMRCECPSSRFYQASTSEMFGDATSPQSETTPFRPRSPYACAKLFAHHTALNYREAYGLHVSCGILFNHESPRRGETFLPRKVARAVAAIKRGEQGSLRLGEMQAQRDWGWAPEYVEAMWLMLQQPAPGDYVIATGESHSVAQFVVAAFSHAGLDWTRHVEFDQRQMRPLEVPLLHGDARLAARKLGWVPQVRFTEIVRRLVDAEM